MLVDTAAEPDAVVRIVVTLRADFLDRPLGFAGFADALKGRTIALGTMSAAELAEAVCRPAAGVGVEVEPALVDRITAEAVDAPGALPLVQHQMAELFAQRTANVVTLAAYEESGGLAGAVGRRAEAIYLGLDDRSRSAAREVFLRLVSVDDEHEDTRRRVRRTELEHLGVGTDELDVVLREYGRHRLLTFDRDAATRTPTVEVAHEALLRRMGSPEGLDRRRARRPAHPPPDRICCARLARCRVRCQLPVHRRPARAGRIVGGRVGFELTEDEQRFLTRRAVTRVDRDTATRTRRRRRIVQVLVGAVVVMAAVAAYALVQRSTADREARETRARELAGQAELAIDEDPERAMMLALAASDETSEPLPESVSALHSATQAMRLVDVVDGVGYGSLEYSPDGALVAVDRAEGQPGVVLIDPANGDVVAKVETRYPVGSQGVAFDPDGDEMAVAYTDSDGTPAVGRFAVASGRATGEFAGPAGTYGLLSYHPDGQWLGAVRLAGDPPEGEIVVWAVDSPGAPTSLGPGTAYGFVPGTTSVVIARREDQGSLAVVDIETGETLRSIGAPEIEVGGIAVDPAANLIALLSTSPEQVVVLDLEGGEQVSAFGLVGWQSAEFSADGRWLAVGSFDNFVHLFDTEDFAETLLAGSPTQVAGVSFAPDGSRLASITDGQLRIWDLAPEGHPALENVVTSARVGELVVGEGESAAAVTLEPPGEPIAVERIDLATGDGVEVADGLHFQPPDMGPRLSADLHMVAGLDDEFRTHVIDLDTGADVELGRCEVVRALDRTGRWALIDGSILCVAELGWAVLPGPGVNSSVLDLRTGRTVLDLGFQDMWGAVFGPPAAGGLPDLVALLLADYTVTVYRLSSGEVVGSYTSTDGFPMAAAFTADGRRLAVTKDTGQLAVIDLARLAQEPADAVEWTKAAHTGSVTTVVTSASGLIATSSFTDNVRVWSPDGAMIADLPVQVDGGSALAFAPGTDTLYYEDGGGVIRRFTLDTDELTEQAESMLIRGFTDDECARYFPGEECPVFAE